MNEATTGDWARALQLVDAALELPAAEREAWLAGQAAEAPAVQSALRALLQGAHDPSYAHFLAQPSVVAPAGAAGPDAQGAASLAEPGHTVGPWQLVRLLGRGGMAQVWLAERTDAAHHRPVALKLPHRAAQGAGADRGQRLAERFVRERQILSSLRHPHIAQVLDAGSDAGQPWLAMEYIDGDTLTEHARQQRLNTEARLRLFLQVLDAVAHAHARLVLHRDIKPANVLVDSQGQVKLLDFGVAKLLHGTGDAPSPQARALTQTGAGPLTLQYASPEQVAGRPLSTASDVYALGVLLYELLTGRLPYTPQRPTAAALEEAILDSRRLAPSQATTDPALARTLRGDLDTICAKALAPETTRRYSTVQALADDIGRVLRFEPINARPASLGYRLAKLWQRQRLLLSAAGAVLLALLLGLASSLWQVQRVREQAALALERQQASQAVQLLIESSLAGRPAGVLDALAQAEDLVRRMYADYPKVQAEILMLLANKHGALQRPDDRARLMAEALAAARASGEPALQAAAECRSVYAYADDARVRVEQALAKLGQGQEYARARYDCWGYLATLLAWDNQAAEAEAAAERSAAELPRLGPLRPLLEPDLHETRADVARASGRLADAEASYGRAHALLQASGRGDSLQAAVLLNYQMLMRHSLGRPQEALVLSDQLLAQFTRLGSLPNQPAYMLANRSAVQLALGDAAAAEHSAALAVQRALDTRSVVYEAGARGRHVEALIALGRLDDAATALATRQATVARTAAAEDGRGALLQARLALARQDSAAALAALAVAEPLLARQAYDRPALLQALLLRARAHHAAAQVADAHIAATAALALAEGLGPAPSAYQDEARALLKPLAAPSQKYSESAIHRRDGHPGK